MEEVYLESREILPTHCMNFFFFFFFFLRTQCNIIKEDWLNQPKVQKRIVVEHRSFTH